MGNSEKEIVEGYVVDIICLRHMPSFKYSEQAKQHTTSCALMGHCMESGYGLVGEQDRLIVLDPKATPWVVALLKRTDKERGVRLKVEREKRNEEMETVKVSEL